MRTRRNHDGQLLEIRDLAVDFKTRAGVVRAVDGVSLTVSYGETVGVLGESGSGKSVTAQAVMGLVPRPAGRIVRGEIWFKGQELTNAPEEDVRKLRGREIAMIFQDPLSSLNPVFRVGYQIGESLKRHRGESSSDARQASIKLMERVGIPDAAGRVDDFPHQFSGGMRQRIMIAMALAMGPSLLIADEPSTALDVTVQAQIMALLARIQREEGMAILLITHDMSILGESARRVNVMYGGRIMECGSVRHVFDRPAHPYTQGLMRSAPTASRGGQELIPIPGQPPAPYDQIDGCPFHPRCAWRDEVCKEEVPGPAVVEAEEGEMDFHTSACHFWEEVIESDGR